MPSLARVPRPIIGSWVEKGVIVCLPIHTKFVKLGLFDILYFHLVSSFKAETKKTV